jgi:hypothetical protein
VRTAGAQEVRETPDEEGHREEEGEAMRLIARSALCATLASCALAGVTASAAHASAPWWHFTSSVRPSTLKPGGEGRIGFRALNVGDAPTSSENGHGEPTPVTITATLPVGLTVPPISVEDPEPDITLVTFPENEFHSSGCGEPTPGTIRCTYEPGLLPFEFVEMSVGVKVEGGAGGAGTAEVSGGGAPPTSLKRAIHVGEAPPAFEVEEDSFSLVPEAEGGGLDPRAGSHPFQLTTNFALNQTADTLHPPALPRDLRFTLPPGLVANAATFPRCSEAEFLAKGLGPGFDDQCQQEEAVGVVVLTLYQTFLHGPASTQTYPVPVFNLTPKRGEPARFGFYFAGTAVPIDFSLRTGGDYGATANVSNITQIANFMSESLTIWGVPGEPAHDFSRGWGCLANGFYRAFGKPACNTFSESHPAPFLTLPTSCATPFAASVDGGSWPTKAAPSGVPLAAREYSLQDGFGRAIGLTGCDQLPFGPSVEVTPDTQSASTSTGITVHVRVPQEANQSASGPVSSSIRDISVALPEGLAINPSGANGLAACSNGLIGYEGRRTFPSVPGAELLTFSPRLPGSIAALEAGETAALQPGANFCATASKVGTVKIVSPLVKEPLTGAVYVASQNENPFGTLIAMYIVAEDEEAGVLVKLPGEVQLTDAGQIVTTFKNNPQLPFEDAELHFFGPEGAPLATPARCGPFATTGTFTPWSGGPSSTSSSTFRVVSGPGGTPCPGSSLPFSPRLTGGSTNVDAGAFSPLTTTVARDDGQQQLQSVQVKTPPGVSGILKGVTLCTEQQANEGTCGPGSMIGETTVTAGVGNEPVTVPGGKVYLTEQYAGAPFGLSIVSPVKAGPFDLEHDTSNPSQQPACDCIVVRAKIEVDPHTAALTVTTDASGPHAIPRIVDGVPVQLKQVNVTIGRERFTFNPTNCNRLSLTGAIMGDEGAIAPLSVPFAATNCAKLKFAPKFSVVTSGHATKANGTSLFVKLAYPSAPFGTYANIAKVKVSLPKQLPSRLTTLNKACTAAVFGANPANCPKESVVGRAKVITPVLPVPLEGNAYFVSHAAEAFPDLTIVLHGYGITVDLVGSTQIKNGITTTTFKAAPDVPFSTFELDLPAEKFSALTANANLCTAKLAMPTEFTAQNGAVITQSTPIAVTGCSAKLSILSRSVRGRQLALRVYVPAAGRLKLTGRNLTSATRTVKAREVTTVVLKAKRAGAFKTRARLTLISATGRRQGKSLPVRFKK